ncbi:DoxX family protein [Glutamicibacter sp. NPDC087344]|uniref:DoxX family protein n=1 Tax=Glutamicibacter sp. NPDC087344 TaxID=3363994 RepID=UPI003806DEF2
MLIVLWLINAVLSLLFLSVGTMKIVRPKAALMAAGMNWTENTAPLLIKAVGLVELLGGLGLFLPLATGTATLLAPTAALGLSLTMLGAVTIHLRRKESFLAPAILCALCVVSAFLGFAVLENY